MKKLIGTAVLAGLLAASAFAEINFGAWLRVVAAPVAGDGENILSGMTNSWGWGARTARINIDATSEDEKVGFSMGVYNDAWDGLSAGDNYVIWAKPWDFLKISLGKWDYTAFRGDLCFGSWNWIRPLNWLFADEGLTFDQLGNQNGIQLELAPVEGLLIMWNLPLAKGFSSEEEVTVPSDDEDGDETTVTVTNYNHAYKMFQKQHIAAKYTIGDIGTIKAGWNGEVSSYDGDAKYLGDVNVAFDLTAVENLYLTVGAKIAIANSDYKDFTDLDLLKVALGASYNILDNLKISANFGVQTHKVSGGTHKPDFQFGVGVDVGLTDTLALTADFRGLIKGDYEFGGLTLYDGDAYFSFLVGLQYNISSNGYVGIGFQGSTNGCGLLANNVGIDPYKADSFTWAVPIAVSVWF